MYKERFNEYLKNSIFSFRMITILVIWIFMMDLILSGYRSVSISSGQKDVMVLLPFLQNNFFFNKIILLSVLCFFSEVPFMSRQELYVVVRLGKKKWGCKNIGYIMANSLILSALLVLSSIVLIIPTIRLSGQWGSLIRTISVSGMVEGILLEVNADTISSFQPYELLLHQFLINSIAFCFLGMLLYTLSLFMKRIWAYICVVSLIFLPSVAGKLAIEMDNYSPCSWVQSAHWRYGFDNSKPDLVYIYVAFTMLIAILIYISQIKLEKSDWIYQEITR